MLNQTWDYTNFTTKGYDKNSPYAISFPIKGNGIGTDNYNIYGCGIQGYGRPINPDFSRGCF